MIRIGCDLDGVLANWNACFARALKQVAGVDRVGLDFVHTDPPVWNWMEHYGYSPLEIEAAFWKATQSPHFWLGLRPLPLARKFLESLSGLIADGEAEVYFLTQRQGIRVKERTEGWLIANGMTERPTVLITPASKGGACQTLGLDLFIDDKPENCIAAHQAGVPTVFMVPADYNERYREMTGIRVGGLEDVMQFLEAHACSPVTSA